MKQITLEIDARDKHCGDCDCQTPSTITKGRWVCGALKKSLKDCSEKGKAQHLRLPKCLASEVKPKYSKCNGEGATWSCHVECAQKHHVKCDCLAASKPMIPASEITRIIGQLEIVINAARKSNTDYSNGVLRAHLMTVTRLKELLPKEKG